MDINITKLSDKEIFDIGEGSFVQYFRSETIYDKKTYDKDCIKDVKDNFFNYLGSDEKKDHKLLIPLLPPLIK